MNNYILLRPVRSMQAYPRVFLRGAGAQAQFNTIMVGLKESIIDMGSYAELAGRGTRADAISRAVARDRSTMFLRGEPVGRHNESRGHLDGRGMRLSEGATIRAVPELTADQAPRSQLSHEAAVGPIAEEAVEYLMTRGAPPRCCDFNLGSRLHADRSAGPSGDPDQAHPAGARAHG